jgi:hypothetical protein
MITREDCEGIRVTPTIGATVEEIDTLGGAMEELLTTQRAASGLVTAWPQRFCSFSDSPRHL